MFSGHSDSRIYILPCAGTDYMHIMVAYLKITFGNCSRRLLSIWDGNALGRLINSKCLCISIAIQTTSDIYIRVDATPRWSGLNHFSTLMKTSDFKDGCKYEDISKVSVLYYGLDSKSLMLVNTIYLDYSLCVTQYSEQGNKPSRISPSPAHTKLSRT